MIGNINLLKRDSLVGHSEIVRFPNGDLAAVSQERYYQLPSGALIKFFYVCSRA